MCDYNFADFSEQEYVFFARDLVAFRVSMDMRRITTDRIHDGGPIRLYYYNIIIPLCYNCLQYLVQ